MPAWPRLATNTLQTLYKLIPMDQETHDKAAENHYFEENKKILANKFKKGQKITFSGREYFYDGPDNSFFPHFVKLKNKDGKTDFIPVKKFIEKFRNREDVKSKDPEIRQAEPQISSPKRYVDHNDERDYKTFEYEVEDDQALLEEYIAEAREKYDISREYFLGVRNLFPTATLPEVMEKLPEYTINEQTKFFRESNLRYIAKKFVPELIAAKHGANEKVQILSAGCSTGEEPYSLAFYLQDEGIQKYKITGIDVSSDGIKKAEAGRYVDSLHFTFGTSFSGIRKEDIASGKLVQVGTEEREGMPLFKDEDPPIERYAVLEVSPSIKKHLSFERVDLLAAAPPGSYDVVTVNNMLYHFPRAKREVIFRHILSALRPGGYIALESDSSFHTKHKKEYLEWRKNLATNFELKDVVFIPPGKENSEYYQEYPIKGMIFQKPTANILGG